MVFRVVALLIVTIAVSGCRNRVPDDFLVPASHPANALARPAPALAVTDALEPEFENVRPKLEQGVPKAPSGPGHKH